MIEIPSDLHPDLVPLAFLLGNWQGAGVAALDGAEGPGTEKCNFGQEVTFSHDGRDFLEYVSHTWELDAEGKQGRARWRPRRATGASTRTARSRSS